MLVLDMPCAFYDDADQRGGQALVLGGVLGTGVRIGLDPRLDLS